MPPSLDNIFGDAPAAGAPAAAPTAPSLDHIFGPEPKAASSGPSVDNIFASSTPTTTPSTTSALPPVKPVDTTNFFSKTKALVGNLGNMAMEPDAHSKAAQTTMGQLPSAFAQNLPFGVGDVFKEINSVANDGSDLGRLSATDWGKSIASAIGSTIAGIGNGLASVAASTIPAKVSFKVPGLGTVSNIQYQIAKDVHDGYNPSQSVLDNTLNMGGKTIGDFGNFMLNALFLGDILATPMKGRPITRITATMPEGMTATYKGQTVPKAASGRIFEQPVNVSPVTPAFLAKAKETGADLGKHFDPTLPTYLQTVSSAKGKITSSIVQIRPSYLTTAMDFLRRGEKPPAQQATMLMVRETSVKALESGAKSAEIAPLAVSHGPATDQITKTGTGILQGHVAAETLHSEVKDILAKHGPDVTVNALQERLGISAPAAQQLLTEAKVPTTPKEIQAGHEKALHAVTLPEGTSLPGVNPKQATRLSTEEAAPHAASAAANYWNSTIAPSIREGGPAVIGGDDLKEHFGKDYNDNNHPVYSQASNKLYERALKEVKDPQVSFTAGGPGSGKTEILVNHLRDEGHSGIIYDSNFSSYEGARKQIEMARAAGKTVDVYGVLPNLEKSRGYTLAREAKTGRGISDKTFAHGHSEFPKTVQRLLEDGILKPDEVHLIDTRETTNIDHAKELVRSGSFEKEPLAKAKSLGYTKEDIIKNYGKENYTKEGVYTRANSGELQEAGVREEAGKSPARSGANSQAGFVNPGAVAEDVAAAAKKLKETIDKIENARELTGDVRDGIYQHENARKASRERLTKMLTDVGDLLDAQGWENLYHYDENKAEGQNLSDREVAIYNTFVAPLKRSLTDAITKYREAGGVITPDLFFMNQGEYTPRFAKDKQSALDKLIAQGKKAVKSIQNGGLLSKSLGTVSKTRKFFAATDENGKRITVYVPTSDSENVLAFKDGKVEDLGPVKGVRSPKVKEYFDDAVMRKLNDLASSLGVTHERVPMGQSRGLGHGTAGVSFGGEDLIKTRLSPSSVLAHELGHQIDAKYGMQAFMKDERYDAEHKTQVLDEMRQLADKRFDERDVPESFKKYVRKGSEKMAVMFEAYVSNREMFKDVAPHLYDDFTEFLASHSELKPFLDIQPGVSLGSETHGGQQSGKIGSTFVDKNGKEYKIGQATTREIESNTNTKYHKNVLANYTVALDRSTNALSAMRLLERLKNEQEFGEIIKKDSPDEAPPEGWKAVGDNLPQFRGYHMEPRTAEALEDLARRQRGQVYIPVFDEVNNLLITAIVVNPVMHVPNVIAGRSLAAAAGDVSAKSFSNLRTAINEVKNKGPLYLDYLEHGAPFMALKGTTKNFSDAVLTQYTEEVQNDPTFASEHEALAKALGYANPAAWMRGLGHLNESITWGSNDIFFMHALMDYKDAHGGTMEDAIKEVSKRMADYRIPERILLPGAAGRALSIASQSRALMFGRFHYSGVIKPWIEAARDSATGGQKAGDRVAGMRSLAYLLLMGLVVWPYLNKMWQGITGSPTTYESMPGPIKQIQVAEKLAQGGVSGIPAAIQAEFSVSPAIKSAIELGFNKDLFTGNPIYGPLPAEGMTTYGTAVVSPLASASRMTPFDFALAQFGVWTPKNVPAKTTLQQMKYNELPALQTQVKKDLAQGNIDKANADMRDYNTRAVAAWNMYQTETGSTQYLKTDAQKQEFLKTWGIKMPGEKAMANAAAHYGDGSLTSKSSLLDTVATYAKAVGVDPLEAFHLMFSGQSIARVTNFGLFNPDSAIIVTRMPLSASQQEKGLQEQAQGDAGGKGLQLDHVIPLEAGGTNDRENLNLITSEQDAGEQQHFEDLLGRAVKDGIVSRAKAIEYSIRYKAGKGETLPDGYMKQYADKYGSKPISLKEVSDAITNKTAK